MQKEVGAKIQARKHGIAYFTKEAATLAFRSALLNQGRFERVIIEMNARSQAAGGEVTSLLPQMKEYWQEFVEQLMRSGAVRALEQDLLAACEAKGEMAFLTIDGAYKPCLSLLGQAPHGSSAATHAA